MMREVKRRRRMMALKGEEVRPVRLLVVGVDGKRKDKEQVGVVWNWRKKALSTYGLRSGRA